MASPRSARVWSAVSSSRARSAWGARSRSVVLPRRRIHGSGRRGRHGGGAVLRPAAPARDGALSAREPTSRGCGEDDGGGSARHRGAGREQAAGGRRSGHTPGTPGARCQPSTRRRRCVRSLDRRADDLGTEPVPDIIEGPSELAVTIADQDRAAVASSSRVAARLRACWATQAPVGLAVTPARCTRRVRSWMKNSTYSRCRNTVSTVRKSQARMPAACWRRNARQVGDAAARRGAGWRPLGRAGPLAMELAETRQPSRSSSPRMRWSPHRGFSLASATVRA
jgi:hypothetical protein